MSFQIRVEENSAYGDDEAAYTLAGEFTSDEALLLCREMVDADLAEVYVGGMSADVLLKTYRMFGRDPYILGASAPAFSAWDYAEKRATELTEYVQK